MSSDQALYFMQNLLWNAFVISGPILIGTLIVGILVSIFQVATQIQEITLSYVPKMLTAGILLVLLGSWLLERLNIYALTLYNSIPNFS